MSCSRNHSCLRQPCIETILPRGTRLIRCAAANASPSSVSAGVDSRGGHPTFNEVGRERIKRSAEGLCAHQSNTQSPYLQCQAQHASSEAQTVITTSSHPCTQDHPPLSSEHQLMRTQSAPKHIGITASPFSLCFCCTSVASSGVHHGKQVSQGLRRHLPREQPCIKQRRGRDPRVHINAFVSVHPIRSSPIFPQRQPEARPFEGTLII